VTGTPSEAYTHARGVAHLDFLAITEHNHADAGSIATNHALYTGPGSISLIPTANSFVEEGVFIALYGQEFSSISKGNHVNVIDGRPPLLRVADRPGHLCGGSNRDGCCRHPRVLRTGEARDAGGSGDCATR
jgi:hypothetical protein